MPEQQVADGPSTAPVQARAVQVLALRRTEAGEQPNSNASGVASVEVGTRLARLVSEAPPGVRLRILTCGDGTTLRLTVVADAPGDVDLSRFGLPTPDAVVRHLIAEVAGMLGDVATCSDPAVAKDANRPESREAPGGAAEAIPQIPDRVIFSELDPTLPALRLLPRGPAEARSLTGFRTAPDSGGDLGGDWSLPRPGDPAQLSTLLLSRPDLVLVQVVQPLSDAEIERARADQADDLTRFGANAAGALGTPVSAAVALVATEPDATLPLRLREHLRGWFDVVDLDEMTYAEACAPMPVPELLAGGLLRFPTSIEDAFPGLQVEPAAVPFELVDPPTDGVRIGVAQDYRHRRVPVILDDEMMSRHVHVVGEPGSGKSTVLTAMAVETARRGGGLLMLDPHGTTVDRILAELPPEARDRVILIRCGDTANPARLNPLNLDDADLQDVVVSDMLDAFQQLFDPRQEGMVGPRFQHIMRHALSTLIYYRCRRASLLDVPRLLYDRELLQAAVAGLHDDELAAFWRNDVLTNRSSDFNEVIGWVSSKFTTFASNKAMKSMLATGEDSLDPAEAMADDRIVLVDLDKGTVGAMGARILGLLYLMRFWTAALGREEPRPFTLLVDEASSFAGVTLPAILSEGRKFGLRAVVAHQFMSQLAPALGEALEGGAATRLVFRVGPDDARDLAVSTYPEFAPLDLTSLPQFVSAARIASAGSPTRPFTLTIDHNLRVRAQPDAAEAVELIRARSIREVVDPYRDAEPMTRKDLLTPPPQRPTSPGESTATPASESPPHAAGSSSFLDDWLRSRQSGD